MKLTKDFYLSEFIDPETYKQYGKNSVWFIDYKVINIAQLLRDRLNKVLYINTWFIKGVKNPYQFSGFRPPSCSIGASKSQHKFGRAIDIRMSASEPGYGSEEIYDEIIAHSEYYQDLGLTTIEDLSFTPTWVHLDVRQTNMNKLFIIKP